MEKFYKKPTFTYKEGANWLIFSFSTIILDPFSTFDNVHLGFVDYTGTNHEQIDLSELKDQEIFLCGATFGKTENLTPRDCSFQNQILTQLPESRVTFLHFLTRGNLRIMKVLENINKADFQEVQKALIQSKKVISIAPNAITINNFFFLDNVREEKSLRTKILNKMGENFLFKNEQWYKYEKPIWKAVSPDSVSETIRENYFKIKKIKWISTPLFNSVFNDLKTNCIKNVDFATKVLGFENGVFNLQTLEFEDGHQLDIFKFYYLRDYLPYSFTPFEGAEIKNKNDLKKALESSTPKIFNWFSERVENFDLITIIFCFAAAILKTYNLDRFLYFFGPSNTGKSTAIQFFDTIFIKSSVVTKQLSDFSSQFGLAELADQSVRLLVVRDAEGSISNKSAAILKNLVSNNEPISVTRKFLPSVNCIFSGGIIIASNFSNIFQKSAKGILEKRIIPIEFANVISAKNQKELEDLFPEDEISNFISLAMKMEKLFVLNTLRLSYELDIVTGSLWEQF